MSEHQQPPKTSRRRAATLGIAVLSLVTLQACGRGTQPTPVRSEAHFAVTCPVGERPGITNVADSGAVPRDPNSDRGADSVVELTCFGNGEQGSAPQIEQDKQNGGKCLGYKALQSHVVIEALTPAGVTPPNFFAVTYDSETSAIGVIGEQSTITEASVHKHDLSDDTDLWSYKNDGCDK